MFRTLEALVHVAPLVIY